MHPGPIEACPSIARCARSLRTQQCAGDVTGLRRTFRAPKGCTSAAVLFSITKVNVPPMSNHPGTFVQVVALDTRKCQMLLRKEVIQPHLPVRLPCYDLVLITDPTFDSSLLAVGPPASGVTDFHDLTGGVYKARERIHRGVADPRLLATPTS